MEYETWEHDMRRARALSGVVLFTLDPAEALRKCEELNAIRVRYGIQYDPAIGSDRSGSERMATRESIPDPLLINMFTGRSGKR
jgi:hypothetical protein